MLNARKWQILSAISSEKSIDQIDPPLSEAETRYYEDNLKTYLKIKQNLAPGISFQFVPPNDCDYDESEEPWPPSYPANRTEQEVLETAVHYLQVHDEKRAATIVQTEFPFEKSEQSKREYSMEEMLELFIHDGFIDRYSGEKLIHPGMLRALSELLGKEIFPYHPHWKACECHPAYWKYQPSVDHISPVSLGGENKRHNWVTTSFSRNQAKGNASLEQIGWEIKPCGNFEEWDGLTRDFLAVYELYPKLHKVERIRKWYQATVKVMHLD